MSALARELHASDEPPVPRQSDGLRLAPLEGLGRWAGSRRRSGHRQRAQDQGDAGQHQDTLFGNAFSSGALDEPPNCSTMFDTDTTLADVSRRNNH